MDERAAKGIAYPRLKTIFKNWTRFTFTPEGAAYGEPLHGFHCANTLLLSHYRMTVNGDDQFHRFSTQASATDWLIVGTIPSPHGAGDLPESTIPIGGLDVSVHRRVDGGMTETIRLCNNDSRRSKRVHLCFELAAPIADDEFDLEMKDDQKHRPLSRQHHTKKLRDGVEVSFHHVFGKARNSKQKIVRGIDLQFHLRTRQPHRFQVSKKQGRVFVNLHTKLDAKKDLTLKVFFDAQVDNKKVKAPREEVTLRFPKDWESASDSVVQCRSSNPYLDLIFEQAVTDLATLKLGEARPYAIIAGIPRYIGIFGRDSLITGWQSAAFDPEFHKDTILTIGRLQGTMFNPKRDEEPGRLPHERRLDPRSMTGQQNRDLYYGDVTSTPFYCMSLNDHYLWHGDLKFVRSQKTVLMKCCKWILRRLGEGGGFVYYQPAVPASKGSNRNQAWKDSGDAIVDRGGHICVPPLALVEIQGYCYEALNCAARLLKNLKEDEFAKELLRAAKKLKLGFNNKFWQPRERLFALALKEDGSPIVCKASNIGHCIGGGIIDDGKIAHVVRSLMSEDMFSGWGIRTLSSDNPSYDPFSYHRGSVWPVENGEIAARLSEIGKTKEAQRIITAQLYLATLFAEFRLPEVVSGHEKSSAFPIPGLYPQANLLQAWSASATLQMVQSMCGMSPDAFQRRLTLRPALPSWLNTLRLDNICFAGGHVSFEILRRSRDRYQVRILKKSPGLKIRVLR